MSSCREVGLALCVGLACAAQAAPPSSYPGIGRPATPAEVVAWDIDVRPDFKGLPKGAGSVARGMQVWEAQCASCHGYFGENNEVFTPLVGGTTAADVKTGRVARLTDESYPGRTTLMKLATVSTLWDYTRRAMPWNAPKSLTTDEVYAVTAYMLHLGGVLPDDFTLSERNIAEVQQRLPNRHGMTTNHGLWPGRTMGNGGRPDVSGSTCMTGCSGTPVVASRLPEHARNAHGNLALQNRGFGAQVGADTTRPAGSTPQPTSTAAAPSTPPTPTATPTSAAASVPAAAEATRLEAAGHGLARQHECLICHGVDRRIIGPAFRDVARKHADRPDVIEYLTERSLQGGVGVWGSIPMPRQRLGEADARAIAQWLTTLAPR
jgi:S-disulfanyl-L-cysteine oxidoreductase SoxD